MRSVTRVWVAWRKAPHASGAYRGGTPIDPFRKTTFSGKIKIKIKKKKGFIAQYRTALLGTQNPMSAYCALVTKTQNTEHNTHIYITHTNIHTHIYTYTHTHTQRASNNECVSREHREKDQDVDCHVREPASRSSPGERQIFHVVHQELPRLLVLRDHALEPVRFFSRVHLFASG